MLTEQRYEQILKLLEKEGSITVTEVKELLNTSESTVRRDITALHNAGKLVKVFGGAIASDHVVTPQEPTVAQTITVHVSEKQRIAAYASEMIRQGEFIYLDAGTTTGYMLEFLKDKDATVVTNAVVHAQTLAAEGVKVHLVGGELKSSTEAVVGSEAIETLRKYHFTKGFFGTNGITKKAGFTTPDANEAMVKKAALGQCQDKYILCDHSKFGEVSSVTFAPFTGAKVITDLQTEGYQDCDNIIVIE